VKFWELFGALLPRKRQLESSTDIRAITNGISGTGIESISRQKLGGFQERTRSSPDSSTPPLDPGVPGEGENQGGNMEKVEKLLLLVVLGAAMIIMSVMSFGTEGPEKHPKDGASGQKIAKEDGADSQRNAPPGDSRTAKKRGVDQLLVDLVDGPGIETPGKPGSEPGVRKDDAAGSGGGSVPEQPAALPPHMPGTGTGLDAPKQDPEHSSKGVEPAVLALEPSTEPGMWTYRVKAGDTMGGIAKRFTGSPRNA